MTAPLRIALVGAGSMGSLHARVISSHEATQLVAVVDPNKEVARVGSRALRDNVGR